MTEAPDPIQPSQPLSLRLPLELPLQGSRLIEASAGTGKTWTIAALYLRLVLGHGCAPRSPGEILVMTFTRAATRELSDRIRGRLVQAAACLRDEPAPADDPYDPFLHALRDAYAPGPAREEAAWRAALAAEAMDDAAVHTIDAWCQRMLREHAFDSGCLFDEELQAQETALRAQALRDYWRQQVYPLDGAALDAVLARWPDVDALARDLKDLHDKPLPAHAGQGTLADALQRGARQREQALAALKAGWVQRADEMRDWLLAQWTRKDCALDKKKLGQVNGDRWLQALKDWALDAAQELPELSPTAVQRLTPAGICGALKPGATVDLPPVFEAFAGLMEALAALPDPGQALRLHAATGLAARMQQIKAAAGRYGFADMLQRLDAALDEAQHGERARRLRQRILQQYPVALIDEFQDTSPLQLRIFDRLYRIAEDAPERCLLLIGDPKQAIYGFRGADIYSYLQARRATAGRHHALDTNHRSTAALVDAVNGLFARAQQRPGEGAFMFGAGSTSDLPFAPVQARGRPERLCSGGQEMPALTLVVDEALRHKDDSLDRYAALCAQRIVELLADPQAGFVEEGRPFRHLCPADIAVLVRNRHEAHAVRQQMRARGLASVYLSDKDLVWVTPQARDLLCLLQAVAAPRDARRARAALASALLGYTVPELLALAGDERLFDQMCERLQQLQQTWSTQGVLAMLRRALFVFDLPARWLARDEDRQDGERALTNVLQLAELLQAASTQAQGEQALIRWLAQQIAEGEQGVNEGDEAVMRLESDADLVQVVTVHKSKGLEYPVVMLPFAAHFRELGGGSAKNTAWLLPDPERPGAQQLVLSANAQQQAVAERERQREELRLLYVALTRARHALWVGVSALVVGKSRDCVWQRSAIGYLLSGASEAPPGPPLDDVQAYADANPGVRVQRLAADAHLPPLTRLALPTGQAGQAGQAELAALAPPAVYVAEFDRQWAIGSYSALLRDRGAGVPSARAARTLHEDEPAESGEPADTGAVLASGAAAAAAAAAAANAAAPWHRFPRGALAGNFLHGQLEWLAGEGFQLDASPALHQALAARCERQGHGARAEEIVHWLRRVCSRVLPGPQVALSALAGTLPEMEFWFPVDGLAAAEVDRLCRLHILPGRPRPALPQRALVGMLMGFADLVFEHQGRCWVLDYKSNALGQHDADYTPQAMAQAMLEHRYDVQAAIYLLALHRLLRARRGAAYAPAQELGGALYLFLRGIETPGAGSFVLDAPLALLDALDALLAPVGGAGGGA